MHRKTNTIFTTQNNAKTNENKNKQKKRKAEKNDPLSHPILQDISES